MFRATYRLQLHKTFRLEDAARLTGYLEELGVSHLYLSPILESRPGSNHGYDGTDPARISDERGGEEGFDTLVERVRKTKGLEGVILDIVPNHLCATWQNPYWWDALEKGPRSKYWTSFDIRPRGDRDLRVVLPVLGRSRPALVAAKELVFDLSAERGVIVRYWDNYFPVNPTSYPRILRALAEELSEHSPRAQAWMKKLSTLAAKAETPRGADRVARDFAKWLSDEPVAHRILRLMLKFMPLKVIEATLEEQNYVLEEWRTGSREINYRRFFDINELAALRVEDPATFKWSHKKIHELVKKYPEVHGLRVDHVDGLTDPEEYLKRLRKISKNVWVEKVLHDGEQVPTRWPITGTTGYEFLGMSSRLFVDLSGLQHLHAYYNRHIDHRWERFHDCMYDSKREMLESHFVSEFNYLVEEFYRLASRGRRGPAFMKDDLRQALKELTSSLRVYRSYITTGAKEAQDDRWLTEAFREVEGRGRVFSKPALNWLRSLLLGKGDWSEATYQAIKRWEQLTGPVMAKGFEDTALYRYFPLLSLNGVGSEPDWMGDGAIEFHTFNQERLRTQPLTMSTTSTHDTKRSEDVRSRIHVLSELSEEWTKLFNEWHKVNAPHREANRPRPVPDLATEYLIYETLLGAWPFDGKIDESFNDRMKQYFLKAVREAKSETSWIEPDAGYEKALLSFVDNILHRTHGREFLKTFRPFAEKCMFYGAFNSLALVTLKALSPGLPDFYQGCELWDMSLVDPDNRRPVDYQARRQMLKEMKRSLREDGDGYRQRLVRDWKSGEIKLWMTWQVLSLRKQNPELFVEGEYIALDPVGEGHRHFVSFFRRTDDRWAFVMCPRLLSSKMEPGRKLQVSGDELLETEFKLPPGAPRKWQNVLTGKTIELAENSDTITAGELLQGLPACVLLARG